MIYINLIPTQTRTNVKDIFKEKSNLEDDLNYMQLMQNTKYPDYFFQHLQLTELSVRGKNWKKNPTFFCLYMYVAFSLFVCFYVKYLSTQNKSEENLQ